MPAEIPEYIKLQLNGFTFQEDIVRRPKCNKIKEMKGKEDIFQVPG